MRSRSTRKRRKKAWKAINRGMNYDQVAKHLNVGISCVIADYLNMKIMARYDKRWAVGERVILIDDSWGETVKGAAGSIVKVYDEIPGVELVVEWDSGKCDHIEAEQVRKLTPLEQLASVK